MAEQRRRFVETLSPLSPATRSFSEAPAREGVIHVYLRFVSSEIDWETGVGAGLFNVAYDLYYDGLLPVYEGERLRGIFDWFNENLKQPRRFSRWPCLGRPNKAICWFRPTAREHLARAREMVALLEDYDVLIWTLKASKVGYVVYEDEHQVVAEPYADTRLKV
jgi:hypothetical protein